MRSMCILADIGLGPPRKTGRRRIARVRLHRRRARGRPTVVIDVDDKSSLMGRGAATSEVRSEAWCQWRLILRVLTYHNRPGNNVPGRFCGFRGEKGSVAT